VVVAVKVLPKSKMEPDEQDRARVEIRIMTELSELNHPHIAKKLSSFEDADKFLIVIEFIKGSDLQKMVTQVGALSENSTRKYFHQIVSTIHYLHERGYVHRDIKMENVMIDENDNAKIIDFGTANRTSQGSLNQTYCGTQSYAAPELLRGERYSGPAVDVWSLGILLYVMLTGGQFPFQTLGEIMTGKVHKEPSNVSEDCLDLLHQILEVDQNKRIQMVDLLHHPWLQNSAINTSNNNNNSKTFDVSTLKQSGWKQQPLSLTSKSSKEELNDPNTKKTTVPFDLRNSDDSSSLGSLPNSSGQFEVSNSNVVSEASELHQTTRALDESGQLVNVKRFKKIDTPPQL